MIFRNTRSGMTLIELIVAAGMVTVISLVIFLNFSGYRTKNELNITTKEIGTLLREAQSKSMSQASGTVWGVRLGNPTTTAPFFALFSTSYATATVRGYYRLPDRIVFATSSIPQGSSLDISFTQIAGASSASTSVTLYVSSQPSLSSTITVASSGFVSF